MIHRSAPEAEPEIALTEMETKLLDQLVPDKGSGPPKARTLHQYLNKVARLGGYLDRAKDPPPGNTVMWRGLSRLTDIKLGAELSLGLIPAVIGTDRYGPIGAIRWT